MDTPALALALVAGAVAAVNPCGFALLPAYLTVLVTGGGAGGPVAATTRALRFTAGMTVGFVAVFGAFGLVVAPLALGLERWLPVLTVVIGLGLVLLGGWLLAGGELPAPAWRRRGVAPSATWVSQVGYGVTFALASLSCTLAPFLAVAASALRADGALGVVAPLVTYALGMGAAVGVLAVTVATAGSGLTTRLRRAAPTISRAGGALLVLAGTYVAWYGWFELRVLSGTAVEDPVVSAAVGVQAALTRAVAGAGATGVLVAAAVLVVTAAVAARRARSRPAEPADHLAASR